jgi:nondiscriminating glutamyl-tRNA synthetase
MTDQPAIRVRFAPSPTGLLHVGGARTALFNWLYARGQGGRFILRIEDTDQARSTEASYAAILRGLEFLGLDWDEGPGVGGDRGPYLQSERLDLYRQHLDRLREGGHAYPCYCDPEALERRREAALAAGSTPGYDGRCRGLTAADRAGFEGRGIRPSWRLRTPDEGATVWTDLVYGRREFQNAGIADRVLVKADGFPTYNFAVVVDDHLMGISHVLRGDDHVSNTPAQLLLYDACGWPRPKFGHLPMILGPDRKRLSKRHGAVSVEEFAARGILPDAMVNYLALLGWSPGPGGEEVLARDQLVKKFTLKRVGSSPAAFDYDKLAHINAEHIKRLSPERRLALVLPRLAERGWTVDPAWRTPAGGDTARYLDAVLRALGNRFSDLARVADQIAFFFAEDYPVDAAAVAADLGSAEARQRLAKLADALAAVDGGVGAAPAAVFEEVARGMVARLGVEPGALLHPCRVALTGQNANARIFPVMELIGAPRVVARLRRAAAGG